MSVPSPVRGILLACVLAQCGSVGGTEHGCACLDNWDYFGGWYHACDARKPRAHSPWCVVDKASCAAEPHVMSEMHTHGRLSSGGLVRRAAVIRERVHRNMH
jgi:hypothetical protein